jgi:hypothetical protein
VRIYPRGMRVTKGKEMTLELPGWASPLISECQKSGEGVDAALKLAADYGRLLPHPGCGETERRWAVLAAVGEHNLTVARVLEAHSDALAILIEAGAANAGRHVWRLRRRGGAAPAGGTGRRGPGDADGRQAVVLARRPARLCAGHRPRRE